MIRKLMGLFAALAVMGWAGVACAQEINAEWIKNLLHPWTEGLENGCEDATRALNGLNTTQLREVRALLLHDRESREGKIVRLDYAPAYRTAGLMRNTIDDMLGQLPYDRVVTGEFIPNGEMATTVIWYDIRTEQGKVIKNAMVGISTLEPYCGFRTKMYVPYKLYLIGAPVNNGVAVIKIEELK